MRFRQALLILQIITYFFPITCIPYKTATPNMSPEPINVDIPKHMATGGTDKLKLGNDINSQLHI